MNYTTKHLDPTTFRNFIQDCNIEAHSKKMFQYTPGLPKNLRWFSHYIGQWLNEERFEYSPIRSRVQVWTDTNGNLRVHLDDANANVYDAINAEWLIPEETATSVIEFYQLIETKE